MKRKANLLFLQVVCSNVFLTDFPVSQLPSVSKSGTSQSGLHRARERSRDHRNLLHLKDVDLFSRKAVLKMVSLTSLLPTFSHLLIISILELSLTMVRR